MTGFNKRRTPNCSKQKYFSRAGGAIYFSRYNIHLCKSTFLKSSLKWTLLLQLIWSSIDKLDPIMCYIC
ncbi:hypothetical protein GYH30_027626 [Glycine max]|uniref:Uncharacterized protein n=1 Tax=Glycine max TaxID=3847 RepID=A0A0R0HRV8_SOYBN|nr:hypothetical protein GYH30_027626 [Glycine max]